MKSIEYFFMKQKIWKYISTLNILRKPSLKYCIDNNLLPSLLTRTPSNVLREILALPISEYHTQLNQDIFALLMNQFRPGFFLEIGANDGFTLSNTVYLEREFGWTGILAEANPKYLTSLSLREKSMIINKAISSQEGRAFFVDAGLYGGLESCLDDSHNRHTEGATRINVECINLHNLFLITSAPLYINFISIDVEGSEASIVEQMISSDRRFRCGCIEFNNRKEDYSIIISMLEKNEYQIMWRDQTMHDIFFADTKTYSIS